MRVQGVLRAALLVSLIVGICGLNLAFADGDISKVNHVIVLVQSNHSFDNYFGALAYAPGSPYHNGNGACDPTDHACVDGLTCVTDGSGGFTCNNVNFDDNGSPLFAFHNSRRCAATDLDPSWLYIHRELNYSRPNHTFMHSSDGFLRVGKLIQQSGGVGNAAQGQTMAFYDQDELPLYYELARNFAVGDKYFASVLGPAFPNRSYLLAATSFGHLSANDIFPPPGGYKPITGTIFDLFAANGVSWANYFQDVPQAGSFLPFSKTAVDPHFLPLTTFLAQAAGEPAAGALPAVSFVDPNFGRAGQGGQNDERPPTDIQRGQSFVSQVISAVRNGPYWRDSVIFLTYDEHGGFYDHVTPPPALQGGVPYPDGIAPGQCADLSNPPASLQPGGGAECQDNPNSRDDTSLLQAEELCPALAFNPTGPYPSKCAKFNQLGVRVPFLAISPFAKPHYISHQTGDHTSILAFIEKRFLASGGAGSLYLTTRDQNAYGLKDLFDFDNSPSLNTAISQAAPPGDDCTSPMGVTMPQHRVSLSWVPISPPVAGYAVYRSDTSGGPYTKLNSVPPAIASYTDSGVLSGHTYYYVVAGLDIQGYQSNFSAEVSAVIPSP